MLRLIIMRHAEAEAARGRRDHARPLSDRGLKEAEAAGRELRAAGLVPDDVLVSDSVRTRTTFDLVARSLAAAPRLHVLPKLYGAAPATVLAALAELPGTARTAMVIGHNPGLGELARSLASRGEPRDLAALRAHFPTACRAVLEIEDVDWRAVEAGRLAALMGAKHG